MREIRSYESGVGKLFFAVCYLLFAVFCLLSCGKKGDPSLKSYEKPDPPKALHAIHRESEIILLWDFPKNKQQEIKGFYLLKSEGEDFQKLAFLEPDKRSYIDREFKIGIQYRYKIISRNLREISSIDSNIILIEPKDPPLPPDRPSFSIEYNSLTLKWKNMGEGISYNLYKRVKDGKYSLMPVNGEPVKENSFRDSFDVNKIVFYAVRSLWGGDSRDEGPASEEIEVNPSEFVPSAPLGLQAVVTDEMIHLIWKEASETWVTGYRVYRETDKKEGFVLIGETRLPTFLDREKPFIKRDYRVTAVGPAKEGPSSEIRDIMFKLHR